MPAEPAVAQPRHPLPELTTYELRDYRRDLEHAIASSARPGPASGDLAALRIQLDAVLAEQESRAALTARGTTRS
jgi:hypothetical protein